ncbi:methyltransferase domain-containing protein [Paraburkholderia rhizosphaerae]|uniref:Thiopurine S-methyltransferase n=1 Tax=Paraburkholderia rhizosphaerae TaxID=480658 RepID=A0A4R8M259_9BURK|nr:methyltransferase domain-containing protein [Paraburkholderia rhizosphaerae]TDY53380.1 thiopurine S-methyltransferase [Paraburkholderia rhizosphaerae]
MTKPQQPPVPPGSGPQNPAAAPEFSTRDPNAADFWDERFAQGFTPWDQAGVPAAFKTFAARHAPMPVLIPGCGSAWEARWLAERGWPVRAIDFASQAVERARTQMGAHAAFVEQADFFAYQPPTTPCWIYERAFLCALPPARRDAYAKQVASLLREGGLLAGFFFIATTGKGPPFGIDRAELDALLAASFELLEDEPVADSIDVFAGRERWLTWRRRAPSHASRT